MYLSLAASGEVTQFSKENDMAQDTKLPEGAGTQNNNTTNRQSDFNDATNRQSGFIGSGQTGTSDASLATGRNYSSASTTSTSYRDDSETGYRSQGRAVVLSGRSSNNNSPNRSTIVGAALLGAVAGAALPFILSGRSSSSSRKDSARVEESVIINKPARELYNFWRNFENLPQFMNNIESVKTLDEKRSHWKIKAPAGTSVEFDSYVVDDVPGRIIAWESEEGASVPNRGRVEFIEAGAGSTTVRATISYDPPAGTAGRLVAKLFMREPQVQAREDLNRLKQLMESGKAS